MTWQTTYPTLATIQSASFDTLNTCCDNLPPPQTDVERTVHRRLFARRSQLADQLLRTKHPKTAEKLDAVHKALRDALAGQTRR